MECKCYFKWPYWDFNEGMWCDKHKNFPFTTCRKRDLKRVEGKPKERGIFTYFAIRFKLFRHGLFLKYMHSTITGKKKFSYKPFVCQRIPVDMDVLVLSCSKCGRYNDRLAIPYYKGIEDLEKNIYCHKCLCKKTNTR